MIIEAREFLECVDCKDLNDTIRPMSGKVIHCDEHNVEWPENQLINKNTYIHLADTLSKDEMNRLLLGSWEIHPVPLNIGDAYKALFRSSKLRYIGKESTLLNETFRITKITVDDFDSCAEGVVLCHVRDEEKNEYQFVNSDLVLIQE